ncbi:MAG TPA: hypothetical protein VKK79_05550 [Candidatus Lokiarchaeia archaeon]|nr:hypothetical protein [Candidatus Lokiarchaeia archaeon]
MFPRFSGQSCSCQDRRGDHQEIINIIRANARVTEIKDHGEGYIEVEFDVTVEVEGNEKPACVAAVVYRYYV